jgi:hypothetical protein
MAEVVFCTGLRQDNRKLVAPTPRGCIDGPAGKAKEVGQAANAQLFEGYRRTGQVGLIEVEWKRKDGTPMKGPAQRAGKMVAPKGRRTGARSSPRTSPLNARQMMPPWWASESVSAWLTIARSRLSVSVGMAAYPDDGTTIEELLQTADRALYEMKRLEKHR